MIKSLNEQAFEFYKNKRHDDSLKLLKESLLNDPNQKDVCKLIGNIYIQLSDLENADKYFIKSFELKKEAEIILLITNIKIKLGKISEAKLLITKNIDLLNNSEYVGRLINILLMLNCLNIAYEIIKEKNVEEIKEELTLEFFLKASTISNDLMMSLKILNKLISINPINTSYLINKSIVLRKLNNNEASIELLKSALNNINDFNLKFMYSLIILHPLNIIKNADTFLSESEKIIDTIKAHEIDSKYKSLIQTFNVAYGKENPLSLINKIGDIISKKKKLYLINNNKIKKIGIVSAYFRKHSVWDAITYGIIKNLDINIFSLHIYNTSNYIDNDFRSATFNKNINYFCGNEINIKHQIQIDQIDLLIFPEIGMDPTTHAIAIDRNASIQLSFWGHPITSGLNNIDYFISAKEFMHNDSKDHYKEPIILMPGLGSYYPKLSNGSNNLISLKIYDEKIIICPSNTIKFTNEFIDLILKIAKKYSSYKIIIFKSSYNDLNYYIENKFSIRPNIFISNWLNYSDYLNILKKSTIVLDSFYFSGFNTLMQATHLNIPFVSLKSDFMKGNFGFGINNILGLNELVANSIKEYEEIVSKLLDDINYRFFVIERIKNNKNDLFENEDFKSLNNILTDIIVKNDLVI